MDHYPILIIGQRLQWLAILGDSISVFLTLHLCDGSRYNGGGTFWGEASTPSLPWENTQRAASTLRETKSKPVRSKGAKLCLQR
jgi:hypothetical protein